MPEKNYCRFQETLRAMTNCLSDARNKEKDFATCLSLDEKQAARKIVKLSSQLSRAITDWEFSEKLNRERKHFKNDSDTTRRGKI